MSSDALGSGRVAVVTGAGSGIGAAVAAALGDTGSSLVLADVDEGGLDAVAAGLRAKGIEVHVVPTDVADAAAVDRLAASTIERFGRVDVVVNNAGVSTFNLIEDQTLQDWRWVFGVNLWGVVHGVQSFLPILRRQGTPAHIVNTASIAGLLSGVPFIGPYAATKVAVVSISETLRAELRLLETPIGVSVLCPSAVATKVLESERNRPAELGAEARTELAESMRGMIGGTMVGSEGKTPAEIAALVVDAIRTDRFWIVTHPGERPSLETRFAEILDNAPEA